MQLIPSTLPPSCPLPLSGHLSVTSQPKIWVRVPSFTQSHCTAAPAWVRAHRSEYKPGNNVPFHGQCCCLKVLYHYTFVQSLQLNIKCMFELILSVNRNGKERNKMAKACAPSV